MLAAVDPVAIVVDGRCAVDDDVVARVGQRLGADAIVDGSDRVIAIEFIGGDVFPPAPAALRVGATPQSGPLFSAPFDDVDSAVFANVSLVVAGEHLGQRRLGPFVDCAAAVDAVVLAASLVIDPLGGPSPTKATATTTPKQSAVIDEPLVVQRRTTVDGLWIGGGAGVGVASGLGPGVTPTLLGRLRVDVGEIPFVVGLGGRFDVPTVFDIDGAHRLESTAAAFFIDACYRQRLGGDVIVELYGVAEAGVLRTSGVGYDDPTPVTARIMGVGAAVQVRAPLWSGSGVFARAALDVPLVRARVVDARDAVLWQSPLVGGLLVVGIDGIALAGGSE